MEKYIRYQLLEDLNREDGPDYGNVDSKLYGNPNNQLLEDIAFNSRSSLSQLEED